MFEMKMGDDAGIVPVTALPDADHSDLIEMAASEYGVDRRDICRVDLRVIRAMTFRGTGVCCERCRKLRDGEPIDRPYRALVP